jgi:hypothetical protein
MKDRSIFNETDYRDTVNRINKLSPSSKSLWGKMNAGQMLAHCEMIHQQALGKDVISSRPNFIMRFIIKKIILSPKPYKQGLPTGQELIMTDAKDFEKEKAIILKSLEEIHRKGVNAQWAEHPAGGKFTGSQWGFAMWKHLDHHLRQFGV